MIFNYQTVPGELNGNAIVDIQIEYEVTSEGEIITTLRNTPIIFLSMIADGGLLYINIGRAAHNHYSYHQKTAVGAAA